ncbi:class I SAM-dependent methyltransferase [Mangrovibacillus cuniculi]|uniref:SAM-dependent methyltransferase n=1 Tax=Mangrovibacillus cuniculi TaxID=2593652 RepID=A0A7S8HFJ3_9BACI|nr:SAM-dependent methyltransferase [Mangrovibacillus cuniculi]QPC46581.1 SAM-dependent methyltransferase [Mangrovibacillus cuniculi]
MNFPELVERLLNDLRQKRLVAATISQPRMKSSEVKRIKIKPVQIKESYYLQFEYQTDQTISHENISLNGLPEKINEILEQYRQAFIQLDNETIQVQISKKFKVVCKSNQTEKKEISLEHNRKKNYLLSDEDPIPFLVRLGVQSADGKIKKQKYDKFKQINRFLEFIEDSLEYLPKDRTIRILDFGSGKSYLTFALYHYLHIDKGYDIRVTGLDLKKDVITECQLIAQDLNYEKLEFLVGDINDYQEDAKIDMVVTLHACDVATDMALSKAVNWGADVILSVPCCQHELFSQLDAPNLKVMTQYGLMKERFSSLATDTIRAELLKLIGFEAQLLEFIDLEHTPKNILIRAYKTNKRATEQQIVEYKQFVSMLGAKPFLQRELFGEEEVSLLLTDNFLDANRKIL